MSELHPPIVHARLRGLAAATSLLAVVASLTFAAGVSPAQAATADDSVSLQAALDPGTDSVITLTSSITLTARLIIPRDVTIDLAGFDLAGYRMTVAPGATFTIDDTDVDADPGTVGRLTAGGNGTDAGIETTGATLVVEAGEVVATGSAYAAGIGGEWENDGGTLVVNGGSVNATGGDFGSGIGGGSNGNGVTTIHGGTVTAQGGVNAAGIGSGSGADAGTFSMDGGTVTAIGGSGAAAIGGGAFGGGGTITITAGVVDATSGDIGAAALGGGAAAGDGGAVVIGSAAVVTARGPGSPGGNGSAIGAGGGSSVFGSLDIAGRLILPADSILTIPDTATATVATGGSITGGGEIQGLGTVANHGTITLAPADVSVALVTDHDYLVTFSPAAPAVRVLASTFSAAEQALPTLSRPGFVFAGWNTAATGTGTPFTLTSTLPGAATTASESVTLYARWDTPTLVVSPGSTTATAGVPTAFTVEGFAPGGASLGDYTGQVTFSTSHPVADQVAGASIEFRTAGTTVVTATLDADADITDTASVTVSAAQAVTVTIVPSDTQVDQGDTITVSVSGSDAYGNAVSSMPSKVDISSDHPTDVISGTSVRFPGASTHVLTATLIADPAVSASASVVVRPAVAAVGGVAFTGADPSATILLALTLLLAGLIVSVVAARRRVAGS